MKILILGGGGFIGSAIVDRMLKDGHEIRVFERPGIVPYRKFLDREKIDWFNGDYLSVNDITKAMESINVVVHLISTTIPKNSNEDILFDINTNMIPTIQLLNIMKDKNVKKILYISSGGTVYGLPKQKYIDESHETEPIVSYGVTKLSIEKYLKLYKKLYDMQIIILRVSNPYGNRQKIENAQGAIGIFLYNALNNIQIEIWGDGTVIRDYIYVNDVADAFASAVTYQGEYFVFNIGSGVGTSLNDLIKNIENLLARKVNCSFKQSRSIDVPSNILCIDLARKELKWHPKTSLASGLIETYEFLTMKNK